jgi:hypothetical protein
VLGGMGHETADLLHRENLHELGEVALALDFLPVAFASMRAKLREIKEQLMAIRHEGTERQGRWLSQVLRGWMAYYAVPMSGSAISAFRHHMIERWHGALMRRSQRRRLTWLRMKKIADRHLPFPRILHPWPESHVNRVFRRFADSHQEQAGNRSSLHATVLLRR